MPLCQIQCELLTWVREEGGPLPDVTLHCLPQEKEDWRNVPPHDPLMDNGCKLGCR